MKDHEKRKNARQKAMKEVMDDDTNNDLFVNPIFSEGNQSLILALSSYF